MTQEDKDLLLKYLCAALPYHVFVHGRAGNDYKLMEINIYSGSFGGTCAIPIPYLRAMSSMTEEEIFEFIQISDSVLWIGEKKSTCILSLKQVIWLLKNHFDFMELIPKNLAIEVTESNNPYKQ